MNISAESAIATKADNPPRKPLFSVLATAFYIICAVPSVIFIKTHPDLSTQGWGFGVLALAIGGFVFPTPITLILSILALRRRERPVFLPITALVISLPGAALFFFLLLGG